MMNALHPLLTQTQQKQQGIYKDYKETNNAQQQQLTSREAINTELNMQ